MSVKLSESLNLLLATRRVKSSEYTTQYHWLKWSVTATRFQLVTPLPPQVVGDRMQKPVRRFIYFYTLCNIWKEEDVTVKAGVGDLRTY